MLEKKTKIDNMQKFQIPIRTSIIIITIIIIIIVAVVVVVVVVVTPWEFFISTLADGFSQECEWQ